MGVPWVAGDSRRDHGRFDVRRGSMEKEASREERILTRCTREHVLWAATVLSYTLSVALSWRVRHPFGVFSRRLALTVRESGSLLWSCKPSRKFARPQKNLLVLVTLKVPRSPLTLNVWLSILFAFD